MKKIVALLIAGVLMAVVSPVALAANLDFTGKLESGLDYNLGTDDNWNGTSRLELGASLGDTLKGGISIVGLEQAFGGNWFNDNGYDRVPVLPPVQSTELTNKIGLDGLWLQSEGSLWTNGPEFTTRMGNLDVNYSPLIATVTDPGVSVSAEFGLANVGLFQAWNETNPTEFNPGHGIHANISPSDGVIVGGTYVKVNNEQSYALEAEVNPVEPLTVEANFAKTIDAGSAMQIGGDYQLTQSVAVNASYRNFEPDFNPIWRDTTVSTDIKNEPEGNPVLDNYGEKGFKVGATAELVGFIVEGGYDNYTQQIGDVKNRELIASVAREFDLAGNKVTAKLSTIYEMETSEQEELDANLKYTAPNGLTMEVNHDFEAEETTAKAGFDMSF
jgi:hypothetical protein